jgi:hypothetical protein
MTGRDFALIDGLARHKVMTAAMLAAVYFPSGSVARSRLLTLTEMGILTRELLPTSGAYRYLLGWHGQVIHALEHDQRPPTKTAAAQAVHQVLFTSQLAHKEGVNAFFARLHESADAHGAEVTEWRSEAEAATDFDGLRPDAAGTLTWTGGRKLAFWFEHDRGTETLENLTAKLQRYPRRRSIHLKADRLILVEVRGQRRLANLAAADPDLGDLAGAAVLYQPFDAAARADGSANPYTGAYRLLDGTGRTVSLAELAEHH